MKTKLDLRHLRDLTGLTQAQTAEKIQIDPSKVVRLENGSEPSALDLLNLMDQFGQSLEELTGFEWTHPDAISVKDKWNSFRNIQDKLIPQVQDTIVQWSTNHQNKAIIPTAELLLQYLHFPKPSIAVVGGVSSGKSTIINAFIGKRKLPAAYEGCTRTVVYLKHISDRPDFFRDTVSVFKQGDSTHPMWDVSRINDKHYCSQWLIASGDMDLLAEYGTYAGSKASENVSAIVVFLDAPLLQNVDIVDCPGFFKNPERMDPLVMQVLHQASIMLYLSPANSFLQMEDVIYLHKAIQILPVLKKAHDSRLSTLHNLYIVASRAHMYFGKESNDLDALLDQQCTQLYSALKSSGYHTPDGNQISYDELRKCFFAYSTNYPSLCSQLHENLQKTIEDLTSELVADYRNYIRLFVDNTLKNIDERQAHLEAHSTELASDTYPKDRNEQYEAIEHLISQCRKNCEQFITANYKDLVDISKMAAEICNSKIENKKPSIQKFVAKQQQEFQMQCDKCVQEQLNILERAIKQNPLIPSVAFSFTQNHPVYDVTALTSAASKTTDYSKLQSIITGSAAIAGSTALFAPAILPFFLSAAGAISATRAFTGNWQKNVARKIANILESSHTLEKCLSANKTIWDKCYQEVINHKKAANLSDFLQSQRLATLKGFLAEISFLLE